MSPASCRLSTAELGSAGLSGLQVWAPASRQRTGQDSHPPGLWLRGGDLPHCSPLVPAILVQVVDRQRRTRCSQSASS